MNENKDNLASASSQIAVTKEVISAVHAALVEAHRNNPIISASIGSWDTPENAVRVWGYDYNQKDTPIVEANGATIEDALDAWALAWEQRPSTAASKRAEAAKLIAEAEKLEAKGGES
jgi:hypothetical protein